MTSLSRSTFLFLVVATLLIVGAGLWFFPQTKKEVPMWKTAQITRGDLALTITATGTVEPEEVIDVGAQVAGRIVSFGVDATGKTVDYGSRVKAGTVLANIDSAIYEAELDQAQAQVKVAQANVKKAAADIAQLEARLSLASKDWQRAQGLGAGSALSQASYDAYKAAFETAKANLEVGKATLLQTKASLLQTQAALKRAQRNLGYCTIKAPVDGVIIDRRVNIGQTVVASLNAPSLFLIAKDLKRIQVWVAVNEADIGKIYPGLPVKFTVDAFAGETFVGEVGKIRLNASMTQNVVTYIVEVITDNSSGRLLPYLTANVMFELDKKSNVLLVPNAALRWKPAEGAKEQSKDKTSSTVQSSQASRIKERGTIWIKDGSQLKPVAVQIGATDGSLTEISADGIKDGMELVIGQQQKEDRQAAGQSNPFAPKLVGGGKKPQH